MITIPKSVITIPKRVITMVRYPHSLIDRKGDSGWILARMRHGIVLAPEAAEDFKTLKAFDRATIRDAIEDHLRHGPTRPSKRRIKGLRGLRRPQYRLRVGGIRVFYDVTEKVVEVLAIVSKTGAAVHSARGSRADRQ